MQIHLGDLRKVSPRGGLGEQEAGQAIRPEGSSTLIRWHLTSVRNDSDRVAADRSQGWVAGGGERKTSQFEPYR